MSREIELLTEIRDLLRVVAEPVLAKRDAKVRSSLRSIVGNGAQKAKAVLLMDGSKSQSAIAKESGMDKGNLSRLLKALADKHLVSSDEKHPRVLVSVFPTFFDGDGDDDANE
jgi:hypothetical protein